MYKDTLKQLIEDAEDLLYEIEADDELAGADTSSLILALDEALSALEDAKKFLK